jgi:hypothetical protein
MELTPVGTVKVPLELKVCESADASDNVNTGKAPNTMNSRANRHASVSTQLDRRPLRCAFGMTLTADNLCPVVIH